MGNLFSTCLLLFFHSRSLNCWDNRSRPKNRRRELFRRFVGFEGIFVVCWLEYHLLPNPSKKFTNCWHRFIYRNTTVPMSWSLDLSAVHFCESILRICFTKCGELLFRDVCGRNETNKTKISPEFCRCYNRYYTFFLSVTRVAESTPALLQLPDLLSVPTAATGWVNLFQFNLIYF